MWLAVLRFVAADTRDGAPFRSRGADTRDRARLRFVAADARSRAPLKSLAIDDGVSVKSRGADTRAGAPVRSLVCRFLEYVTRQSRGPLTRPKEVSFNSGSGRCETQAIAMKTNQPECSTLNEKFGHVKKYTRTI